MKITKYEHSCLDIEIDGKRLLIDPGILAKSIPNYENISAVIVTHVHPDHLDIEKLKVIHAQNPNAPLYTVQAVSDEIKNQIPHQIVSNESRVKIEYFDLVFSGDKHATIHKSIPLTDNVGVLINKVFYYPGDSFTLPGVPIELLALPMTAPWSKISETMDYLISVKPNHVFPVHNALLSDFGTNVYEYGIKSAAESAGGKYSYLKPGESINL